MERLSRQERVAKVMTGDPLKIGRDETVGQAAGLMEKKRVGSLLVVEQEKLVGIITERDLVQRVIAKGLSPAEIRVGEVMSPSPDTIDLNASLEEAYHIIEAYRMMGEHLSAASGRNQTNFGLQIADYGTLKLEIGN
ncbi:MAG: CBS domain-containing protein [bacterium]|nr:CBS domain-containing protein [bacterium]